MKQASDHYNPTTCKVALNTTMLIPDDSEYTTEKFLRQVQVAWIFQNLNELHPNTADRLDTDLAVVTKMTKREQHVN